MYHSAKLGLSYDNNTQLNVGLLGHKVLSKQATTTVLIIKISSVNK